MYKLANFPNNLFMLDIETNGTAPSLNAITSLCLVEFNLADGALNTICVYHKAITNSFIRIPNAATMAWRKDNNVDEFEATLKLVSHLEMMEDIQELITVDDLLFALHTEFDVAFLQSYYDYEDMKSPWNHGNVYELASIILGADFNRKEIKESVLNSQRWKSILHLYFQGKNQPHNAFYDCCLQIELLRWVILY